MAVLKYPFKVLTLVGMWEPLNLNIVLRCFYILYLYFIELVNSSCVFFEFSYAYRYDGPFEDINEALYITLTGVLVNIKFVKIRIDRQKIIELSKMLRKQICIPRNYVETKMERDCERYIK